MDTIPIRLGDIHDVGAAGNPGIVDQDIDLAERRECFPHHTIDLLQITNIGLDCQGASLGSLDSLRRRASLLAVDIGDDDMCPGLGERQGRRSAYSAAGTGDQRHLVRQVHDKASFFATLVPAASS